MVTQPHRGSPCPHGTEHCLSWVQAASQASNFTLTEDAVFQSLQEHKLKPTLLSQPSTLHHNSHPKGKVTEFFPFVRSATTLL